MLSLTSPDVAPRRAAMISDIYYVDWHYTTKSCYENGFPDYSNRISQNVLVNVKLDTLELFYLLPLNNMDSLYID